MPIKADKTRPAPEVEALLRELGNTSGGIPFYAIFPGDGGKPITLDGLLTQNRIIEKLKEAGPSKQRPETAPATQTAALRN